MDAAGRALSSAAFFGRRGGAWVVTRRGRNLQEVSHVGRVTSNPPDRHVALQSAL